MKDLDVHFEKEVPGVDPHERDHPFASDLRHLDRYANDRGLRPLGDFVVDVEAGEDKWFDPHDVQHAAEALAGAAVDDPPHYIERQDCTSMFLGELNNIAMLCRRAAEAHVRVRLTVH